MNGMDSHSSHPSYVFPLSRSQYNFKAAKYMAFLIFSLLIRHALDVWTQHKRSECRNACVLYTILKRKKEQSRGYMQVPCVPSPLFSFRDAATSRGWLVGKQNGRSVFDYPRSAFEVSQAAESPRFQPNYGVLRQQMRWPMVIMVFPPSL